MNNLDIYFVSTTISFILLLSVILMLKIKNRKLLKDYGENISLMGEVIKNKNEELMQEKEQNKKLLQDIEKIKKEEAELIQENKGFYNKIQDQKYKLNKQSKILYYYKNKANAKKSTNKGRKTS